MHFERIWQEDDAAPDAETLDQACIRLLNTPLKEIKSQASRVEDLGDAIEYIWNGYLIYDSYPGNSAIYTV